MKLEQVSKLLRVSLLSSLTAAIVVCQAGCSNRVGSRLIQNSYAGYGATVQSVTQEELLLNLVRRRYFESPQFLNLRGISHSQSVRHGAGVNAGWFRPLTTSLQTGVDYAKEDIPTFSISVQQGPEFAKKLHENIPVQAIAYLMNAGYSSKLVLALVAQQIGDVRGVEVGTGDLFQPGSAQFDSVLQAIQLLEDQHWLSIQNVLWEEQEFEHAFSPEKFPPEKIAELAKEDKRFITLDEGESFFVTSESLLPALSISSQGRTSSSTAELISQLDLDPAREAWVLQGPKYVQGKKPDGPRHFLTVQTRSFYSVLNLLAKGVCVPELRGAEPPSAHQGYADVVRSGQAPDIASWFKVHYSDSRPSIAFVATKTKLGWFYIDANDRVSQEVFTALNDLYQLQVAPLMDTRPSDPTPVLSIRTR
jgi:hypothetical protein